MSDAERTPLLSPANEGAPPTEASPLLEHQTSQNGQSDESDASTTRPNKSSAKSKSGRKIRWPSIIAILLLSIVIVGIMIVGIFVPPAIKTFAEKAAVLEPTNILLESIEPLRVRVQGNVRAESWRVEDKNARRIGKFVARLLGHLETGTTTVSVHMPQYDNALVGTATLPPQSASIVDGHNTPVDFIADVNPGDTNNWRKVANDWLAGNLDRLSLRCSAPVTFKSGILPLGTHDLVDTFAFEANDIPSMPEYQIQHLNFHDIPAEDGGQALGADVSLTVQNDYPITLDIPPLAFEILVPNCKSSEPYILVAEAVTSVISVRRHSNVTADAKGIIRELSDSLTRACPSTKLSPLDQFMKHYLHGEASEVYVRGKGTSGLDTPDWIGNIIKGITVPLEFPGKSLGGLIRNFTLTDVNFQLPSPFADPGDPDSQPRVSGMVGVIAALPPDMKVDIGVHGLRADADLFYKKSKLGELNLDRWQKAESTKITVNDEPLLNITSRMVDVPLNITDENVFSDLMQALLFGDKDVLLDITAAVDAKMTTALGEVVVKEIPAQGKIPVKPLPPNSFATLQPRTAEMRILNTSATGYTMQALVNFTNPSPYTASVPYMNVHVFKEGHRIGEVTCKNVELKLGNNTNVVTRATWDPLTYGGPEAREAARRLLSDYASGKNTTITLRTHRDSFPSMPLVGQALAHWNLTLPAPRFELPGSDKGADGDDGEDKGEGRRFIHDATFHIFSSTAAFTLASPLHYNTIYLDFVNATAFYNHTEPVGQIVHDKPIAAPPGLSQTPRLAVEWSAGNVGYDKVREALGGELKLDAVANVSIRIGNWAEDIVYEGKGIGAKIRL